MRGISWECDTKLNYEIKPFSKNKAFMRLQNIFTNRALTQLSTFPLLLYIYIYILQVSRHRDAWMTLLSSQTSAAAAVYACRFSIDASILDLDRKHCSHIRTNGPIVFIYFFQSSIRYGCII